MVVEQITLRLIFVFSALFLGFVISKVGSRIIMYVYRKRYNIKLRKSPIIKTFNYLVMSLAIILALVLLKVKITTNFIYDAYKIIPEVISVILVIILAVIITDLITGFIQKFLTKSGLMDFIEEYRKEQIVKLSLFVIKLILYVIFGLVALEVVGLNVSIILSTLSSILYPFFILLLLFLFVGLKDFVENYFIGLYLTYSNNVKIGEKVSFRNHTGIIKAINGQTVSILTSKNKLLFVQNKRFLKYAFYYKRSIPELDTLDKIKSYYVTQDPSNCGPASAAIILDIFGHHSDQERIGKLAGMKVGYGTKPSKLINTIRILTKNKVRGAWIDFDRISDLKKELKLWLEQGALVIVDYKKSYLFPTAQKAHYSVCLAVEGDELLLIDPSFKTGGVYFTDSERIFKGMDTYSELIGGKRGYIVLAPKNTIAYYRINNGLIYFDIDFYKKISHKLTKKLESLVKKADKIEAVFPKKVKSYIRKFKEKENIARVWHS